jgi:hypothetical protein
VEAYGWGECRLVSQVFVGFCSDVSEVLRICIIAHKIPGKVDKFTAYKKKQ